MIKYYLFMDINLFYYDDVMREIYSYIDFYDIMNLNEVLKNTIKKEIIYWKSLNHFKILLHDSYLLKNEFVYIYDEQLSELYDYIKSNPNICIAGGYPTLMHYNKNLADYPDSDIDIFVIGPDSVENAKGLLHFINKNYKAKFVKGDAVIDIKIKNYERPLQVIVTQYQNINELLYTFDTDYNKCALYLGDTYITFDAKYSVAINMTHSKYFKHNRIEKTLKKGIQIYNYDHSKSAMLKNDVTTNKVCKKYYKCTDDFNVIAVEKFTTYLDVDTDDLDKTKTFRMNKFYDVMIPDTYYIFKNNWRPLLMKFSYPCDYNLLYTDCMPVISEFAMITIVGKLIVNDSLSGESTISIKIPGENKEEIKKLFDIYDQIYAVLNTKKTNANREISTKCKTYDPKLSHTHQYYKNNIDDTNDEYNMDAHGIHTFVYCRCPHNKINMLEYINVGHYYESKKMYIINLNFSIKLGETPCHINKKSMFTFKYDIITLQEL